MAGLLSFPARQGYGLLSPYRSSDPLLKRFLDAALRPQADAGDEAMYAANPNGSSMMEPVPQNTQPDLNGALASAQSVLARPAPQAPTAPARQRVSGWRVLDRVLGGDTVTGGLDAERERLTAEALKPQQLAMQQENERIARALGPQALLAFRTNSSELGKSLGQQYTPQVVAEGSALAIPGQGSFQTNERRAVVGDRVVGLGGNGQGPRELLTVQPSYDDQTKRINATNPVSVAQNALLIDPATGQQIASGVQRPDLTSVQPGGQIYATDPNGQTRLVGESTAARPATQEQMKRADAIELALTADQNSIARVQGALDNIRSGRVRVGPLENIGAGILNSTGNSNANSLGIADIKTTVESLRQGILNDATGPQTEGDALRALNSILAGINDKDVIAQGFEDYLTAKRRTAAVRAQQLERLRGGQGAQTQSQGGQIAVNPQTGARVQWNGSAWVPL